MKEIIIENRYGRFGIHLYEDSAFVWGDKKAACVEFKKIGRMPPNAYGNFAGREAAGVAACEELFAIHSK